MLALLRSRPTLIRGVVKLGILFYLGFLMTVSTGPANAQVVTFSGAVYHSGGYGSLPVPGAQVLLFNGVAWIGPSITDSYGRYAFYNAPPGTYLLRVIVNNVIVWNEQVGVPNVNHIVVLHI